MSPTKRAAAIGLAAALVFGLTPSRADVIEIKLETLRARGSVYVVESGSEHQPRAGRSHVLHRETYWRGPAVSYPWPTIEEMR